MADANILVKERFRGLNLKFSGGSAQIRPSCGLPDLGKTCRDTAQAGELWRMRPPCWMGPQNGPHMVAVCFQTPVTRCRKSQAPGSPEGVSWPLRPCPLTSYVCLHVLHLSVHLSLWGAPGRRHNRLAGQLVQCVPYREMRETKEPLSEFRALFSSSFGA